MVLRKRLRRFFNVSFLLGAFFLLAITSRAIAAATPITQFTDSANNIVPNDVQKLNQANDERNINNSLNFNSTISNPTQFIIPEGQSAGSGQVVGGDGAWESLLSGIVKGLEMSPPRKTTIQANGKTQTYYVYTPGAIGTTINLTAQLYQHPPASSIDYVADLIENAKHPFVQKAYAQGLGFSSLAPVLDLWKLFRNVAYFFFVVVFVIVGFLIMIRAKIGSQAAVTVQQILPQLVIALILVTFSYAIAGLLIDVMNIVIFLIIGIFSSVFPGGIVGGSVAGSVSLTDIAFRNDIFTNGIGLITNGVAGSIAGGMGVIVQNILVNLGWAQWVTDVLKLGTNVIFTLILTIVILLSLFRVFFALLQAYIGIFFSVIFAPIQLMLGALPGQNTFQKWISGLLENLLVFPTIILMIFIAYFFARPQTNPTGGFSAPQLGSNQGPQGFAVYQNLIALGVILAMPEVVKVTKGILKGEAGLNISDLGKNLTAGVKGGEIVPGLGFTKIPGVATAPGAVANVIPFGVGEATPFRTTGKESALERALIGTRAQRAKEIEYQRQARLFGKDVSVRQGGIYGLRQNERGAEEAARRQVGGGASAEKEN